MTRLSPSVRAEIASQVERAVAERIAPLKDALERIGAQMAEHNAAVEAAQAQQAATSNAPPEGLEPGWFQPKGRGVHPGQDASSAPDSAEIAQQIQRFAELRLQARRDAVNKRCARIQHRMAAHSTR